jgi:putative Holliday junction resolvase
MAKKIAIDFGLKRTGLAITDSSNIIASPLTTIDSAILIDYVKKLTSQENIDTIILGEPKRLNNEDTHISENVRLLFQVLQSSFPDISVILIDERFTSKMAAQSMHVMGMKKKQLMDKRLVDQISATLILQSYLNSISNS